MLIPNYWAEARVQHREEGRQITIRRFGWSLDSQDEAETMARQRAEDALQRALAGEQLRRRERREAYGGADGLPIREEVLERIGDAVITRNQYGVQCLNVPDVLFADIDFPERSASRIAAVIGIVLLLSCAAIGYRFGGLWGAIGGALLSIIPSALVEWGVAARRKHGETPPEALVLERVRNYSLTHPDWGLRLYRTPAGFRVIATHRVFDPAADEVAECFRQLEVDPIFARMCRNQRCFRARLTAKPWRIGIENRIGPRPGIWPASPSDLPRRREWVAAYEGRASGYAACRFVESIGNPAIADDVQRVVALHDLRAQATSGLPIA